MEFRVLGPLEVQDGTRPVAMVRTRERALLSLLLINANTPLADDSIIDALWGESAPRNPKAALQTAVSRLRTSLGSSTPGSVVDRRGAGYVLSTDPESIDSRRFERLVAAAEGERDHNVAVAMLDDALSLWRGPAHSDVRFEDFAQPEIRRLEELRIEASESRIAHKMELGEHRSVIAELESLVYQHPLRESLWSKLMLSLYRCERQTEALRVYQRARTAIAEASGLEPGLELARLEEAILVQDVEPRAERPELDVTAPVPTNLPDALTSFVGRQRDLADIAALHIDNRLISLVGTAGVGKTRLAIRVAREIQDRYPGGVFLIALDKVDSEERLVDVAITAVSLADRPVTGPEPLIRVLRERKTLIILDNCEHLLSASARFADWLIRETSGVTVLTTSRQRLGVAGERIWNVHPLPIAPVDAGSESLAVEEPALDLFLDRMQAVRPDLAVADPEVREAGRHIARSLDGLPLAIELAASQCFTLSPQTVAAQLQDQVGLAASRNPLAPDRHQTLDAALDWSLRLLTEEQRRHFTSLAVVPESFDMGAVAAICDAPAGRSAIEVLTTLVEHSLIERVEAPAAAPRFRILRPIRAAARRSLESDNRLQDLQERYARWLADRADGWYSDVNTGRHRQVREEVRAERWNLLSAIDWAVGNEPVTALRLLAGPRYLWVPLGHRWTAIAALQRALSAAPEPTAVRANALNTLAFLSSVSIALTAVTRKTSRFDLPTLTEDPGSRRPDDVPEPDGLQAASEALEIAERLGDAGLIAFSKFRKGFSLDADDHADEARQLLVSALEELEATPLESESASAVNSLVRIELAQGHYEAAERLAEDNLRLRDKTNHLVGQVSTLDMLGRIARAQGDDARSMSYYRRALDLTEGTDTEPTVAAYLHTEVAYLAMNLHNPTLASRELGLALAAARTTGHRRAVGAVRLAQAQLAIEDHQFDSAHGYLDEALSVFEDSDDPIAVAYTLGVWGLLQHLRSDRLGAYELFRRSIEIQQEEADPIALARAYEGLAAMAAEARDFRRAATLIGASDIEREKGRCLRGHWQRLLRFAELGMSADDYEQAVALGRSMERAAAIEFAVSDRH